MNTKLMAVIAVILLAAGCATVYLTAGGKETGDNGGTEYDTDPVNNYYDYSQEPIESWSYWLGNMGSAGVSDGKTPITKDGMTERWKISDSVDSSSTNWKVPGSAICVGDKTYFFRGSDNTLNCVITSTGASVAKTPCPSDSVYNMAIAYGDGKIFVPVRSGNTTVVHSYDAVTLKQLFVSEPVSGGEVQGPITYYEGRVYLGTYGGEFACFSSEDTDPSRSGENANLLWKMDGSGWYNATPAFFEDHCVIVEKGYDIGGSVAYSVDAATGGVRDSMTFEMEYCVSGIASYKGRAYIPLNSVNDKSVTPDPSSPKTMIIRSFAMNADGTFDRASEKVWTSSIKSGGGTQSTPVIWNDRLYIGGGGSTLGSNEPFTVINIAWNGTMTTAYTVDELKTKGTASLTTAYSTADNGYAVYIYLIEYGKVLPGEAFDSPIGSADIFVLRDSVGQNNKDIVFKMTPSVPQFAYQSFSISSDGYLLVRNDSTLFCYGFGTPGVHTHADVSDEIDRIIKMAENVNVSSADVGRAESRYASLSDPDKSEVSNYSELQDLYRSVTFTAGSDSVEKRYLKGSLLSAPNLKISDGKFITGWTSGGSYWNFNTGTVENDMTLTAVFDDAAVVSFDSAGGSPVRSIYVEKGSEMGYLKDPERDGYTFGGWKAGGTEYVPQHSLVSGDVKLTAVWLKNSTISFDSDGGSQAKSIYVTYSKRIDTLPTVSKSGYAFTGWYYGDVLYTSETVYGLQNDITLKAGWSKNATSSLDNGKGIVVTGTIPAGASLSVVKPFSGSTSISEIKKASGNQNMDFVMITVAGDGVDGSQEFSVELPAGAGSNGKSLDVYYYKTSGVSKVTGTVSDGVLKVSIYGDTGGGGVQIVLGTADGTEIADYI